MLKLWIFSVILNMIIGGPILKIRMGNRFKWYGIFAASCVMCFFMTFIFETLKELHNSNMLFLLNLNISWF